MSLRAFVPLSLQHTQGKPQHFSHEFLVLAMGDSVTRILVPAPRMRTWITASGLGAEAMVTAGALYNSSKSSLLGPGRGP